MHRDWWGKDDEERASKRAAAARELQKQLAEARRKQQLDAAHQVTYGGEKLPPSVEYDEAKTSETAIALVNVCLDDWPYLATEVDSLMREAQELKHAEDGGEFDF